MSDSFRIKKERGRSYLMRKGHPLGELMLREQAGEPQLCCTLIPPAKLDQATYEVLRQSSIPGIFPMDIEQEAGVTRLIIGLSGYVSMRGYYQTLVKQKASLRHQQEFFLKTVLPLLQTVLSCHQLGLSEQGMCFDLAYLFVDPKREEIRFVFFPIRHPSDQQQLKRWLQEFPNKLWGKKMLADSDCHTDLLKRYLAFFESGEPFSAEAFSQHLLGFGEQAAAKRCQEIALEKVAEQHRILQSATSCNQQSRACLTESPPNGSGKPRRLQQTGLTASFSQEAPYLIREKTGEIIVIDKTPFKIGKKRRENDCYLSDNPAISRTHAVIVYRNGQYAICDHHSTNKTKVGGVTLKPGGEMSLRDGVTMMLANERFTFHRRIQSLSTETPDS